MDIESHLRKQKELYDSPAREPHNWWREVDTLSQRRGSSGSIILENSLLQELKDHFSKICTDENYTEPMI